MRKSLKLAALAAVVATSPALAQVNVGLGTNVGVGVNAGGAVNGVGNAVGRTVDGVDRQVNRALSSDAVLVTRADLRTGAEVRDNRGRRIGTVHHVEANSALVVQGNRQFRVPLSALYRTGRGLVTSLSRAEVQAAANASAGANIRR
ncbi:MAG TPA: hypothetical protein VGD10_08345 [Allosphingosinicella sp.]|uniref:hypothetical protein n=1 Tax=Allosphingosinicella sp. TaxID=2823234 RepID=UPI002ED80260